eukprot:465990-Amphidinium_carterae.1
MFQTLSFNTNKICCVDACDHEYEVTQTLHGPILRTTSGVARALEGGSFKSMGGKIEMWASAEPKGLFLSFASMLASVFQFLPGKTSNRCLDFASLMLLWANLSTLVWRDHLEYTWHALCP